MHNYENTNIWTHKRAYEIPGAELGREDTKINTTWFLTKETDV